MLQLRNQAAETLPVWKGEMRKSSGVWTKPLKVYYGILDDGVTNIVMPSQ